MKFYQNIRQFSSLIAVTGTVILTCFSVNVLARGSNKAMAVKATTTTTTTTTEATTESTTVDVQTTQAVSEQTTEVSTEAYLKADGTPMTDDEIKVYNIVKNSPAMYTTSPTSMISPVDTFEETDDYIQSKRTFAFAGGDSYNIIRYEYKDKATKPVSKYIDIPGSKIEIRYVDDNDNWVCTTNPANAVQKTMYINTDKCSLIVSVPSVYMDRYTNNTLEIVHWLEKPITITQTTTGYRLSYDFTLDKSTVGEIWYLYSNGRLENWNNINHFNVLKQDFNTKHRISFDGYYYPTPYNYTPNGENLLYRQPSDYVGSLFVRYGDFPAAYDLGYVLTYTCMLNQNDQGYWATGPSSEWLMTDFKIGTGFYDTRFNTDFADSLLDAYKRYSNKEFLASAVRYAEYYKKHAAANSYTTKNGGILVQDYGSYNGTHNKTHVSLNHQLAEMNFLYKLYDLTREQSYYDLAEKMLKGIEDTKEQWVLADNNLNYALFYTGTYNKMVDYPFLTYNDLFTTKKLLASHFNRTNSTIEYLMENKLLWMKAHNVTGYLSE